jgi:hypothetical protein
VDKLRNRIDEIMLGKADLDYSKLMMQLDSETGRYEDSGEQTLGHKGSTLNYRKVIVPVVAPCVRACVCAREPDGRQKQLRHVCVCVCVCDCSLP